MESVCRATTQISEAELTRPTAADAVATAADAVSAADTHAAAAAYAPRTTSA